MTSFFETLAARAVGVSPGLRPRAAHRFEPAARGAGVARDGAATASGAGWAAPPSEEGASDLGLELDSLIESPRTDAAAPADRRRSDSRPRDRTPDEPAPAPRPTRSAERRAAAADSRGEPGPPATQARGAARRELRDLAHQAIAHATRESAPPTYPAPRGDLPARAGARADDAARDRLEPAHPAQPAASGAGAPAPPPRAVGDDPTARDQPGALPGAASQVRLPARPPPRPAPGPAPGPDVDLAALLREEVFAALLDRGAVPARERPVVVPPGKHASPPRPGTAAIRAEGMSSSVRAQPRADRDSGVVEPAPPRVHVHIDRVTVTRAAPPPPPQPAHQHSSVDHAAYLARRRERG